MREGDASQAQREAPRPREIRVAENGNGRKYVSHHILPTAANLLGLCFVILSFMKVSGFGLETIIDELVAAAIVIFLIACFYSYASIRSQSRSDTYERIADVVFLSGLGLLAVTAVIIMFEII